MITIISLVTSVKDYLEVVHKLIEYDSININYSELGSIITYVLITLKNSLIDFFSFSWLLKENLLSLPIIIPEISSAMISEISVLDGYFHNAFNFLDTPVSDGMSTLLASTQQNSFIACIEKFIIGGINSFFLFLPTSTAHIITLRRFVMQGLEAGYIAGLGTIAGNIFWLASVILGFRFFVIPWLSLDIFRYLLGFVLLVKYMWDSYNEKKIISNTEDSFGTKLNSTNSTNSTKTKFFLLNFLLALTEQTSIYPFVSNISLNPEGSIIENFSLTGIQLGSDGSNGTLFILLHLAYLLGITVGSLSLLHLSCWFWENPAFKFYMWVISSFKVSTTFYYKALNFTFLYLTMLSAVCSIPYYGLDYTVTNPLGYVNDDRLIQDKVVLETSFLGTKASDRNTRRNRGRHGRRERWKRRIRKYRTFDASLYDQGIYDLFTVEDLNYGFDRFWLRRKLRNHRVRFRFFPGPWMRSFKKQLAKPRLESYTGPRIEFFRILYEQVYHPSFHAYQNKSDLNTKNNMKEQLDIANSIKTPSSIFLQKNADLTDSKTVNASLQTKRSILRKFMRKLDTRIRTSQIKLRSQNPNLLPLSLQNKSLMFKNNNMDPNSKSLFLEKTKNNKVNTFNLKVFTSPKQEKFMKTLDSLDEKQQGIFLTGTLSQKNENFSKKKLQILQYRTLLKQSFDNSKNQTNILDKSLMLLHPLKFYLQQEASFKRKLYYYTPNVYRKFSVENNAPYYRVMMKRYFYNYKPTLRWERTMKVASLRKARRKTTRIPRKLQKSDLSINNQTIAFLGEKNPIDMSSNQNVMNSLANSSSTLNKIADSSISIPFEKASMQKSSYNYSVVSKRASRYRYQIYKDVLQHWYYSPFNRILLKFDVDNFIKRQPNTHFLTTNEEKLLHLRRFLLFEHYNTLRWYTNMQHYRSMKTQLNGGTKSFASRPYNQQFFGTFKKIRHLFAITPSVSTVSSLDNNEKSSQKDLETNVLKFDQLLYNEYPNDKKNSLLNPLIIHEEILPDYINQKSENNLTEDILSQSQNIVRKYLLETRSIREEYIKKLLSENNYSALTQFIYKGQKIRGNEPVTNQKLLNDQEKDYLLTSIEKNQIEKELQNLNASSNIKKDFGINGKINDEFYLIYLKNWKRRVNDQESLKNYLTRRLDKREKRKQKKEKQILSKLKRLENWYSINLNSTPFDKSNLKTLDESKEKPIVLNSNVDKNNSDLLTSGLQKSILDGIYVLNNVDKNVNTANENNFSKVLLLSKIKNQTMFDESNTQKINLQQPFTRLQDLTLRIEDLEKVQKDKTSSDIKTTVQAIRKILNSDKNSMSNTLNSNKNVYNSVKTKITNYRNLCLDSIYTAKDTLFNFTKITFNKVNLFKPMKSKSIMNWRLKERALSKQKRSRKEFKLLNKKNEFFSSYMNSNELELALQTSSRKKRDSELKNNSLREEQQLSNSNKSSYITNSFKRKRSPQRRSRVRRNRGVFKKRNLTDLLRKDFVQFINQTDINEKRKLITKFNTDLYGMSMISTQNNNNNNNNNEIPLKQRKSKQRKERYWKQKRSKFSQKRRKYRKRRRYTAVKIRNINKQLKRIKNKIAIQNWWWKQFIPSIQASNEALWQIERDKLIQQKLSQLSISNILERDTLNQGAFSSLQIGMKDFKPLALPETLNKIQSNKLNQSNVSVSFINDNQNQNIKESYTNPSNLANTNNNPDSDNENLSVVNKLYENLFIDENNTNQSFSPFLIPNTNLPFYAGWDESLRKLVVTNRMLSRKDAGFTFRNDENLNEFNRNLIGTDSLGQKESLSEFSLAPLQGMNAATTLYWQIPFTTYDPDQFFALGMDGFSPIGWRKFLFRHSILKTWLDSRSYSTNLNNPQTDTLHTDEKNKTSTLIVKNRYHILNDLSFNSQKTLQNLNLNNNLLKANLIKQYKTNFANSRRLKKRYRRVKKHPRTPVWFPSGSLSNQVLPVHYIYVFYKRSRLPRDRYLKRRLINVKNQNTTFINNFVDSNSQVNNYDFTLRKRLKPKRKYHIKRDYYASNVIIPRRLKFMSTNQSSSDIKTWRPLSSLKIHKPIGEVVKEQLLLRRSVLQKQRSSKQQPNMRVKQLRRRIQRQVIRTVWRYRPRAGGFVWPGDYLKLESVKAPKLQNIDKNSMNQVKNNLSMDIVSDKQSVTRKQKRKKKRNLIEWQIQPKKYLYEKHNLQVIKKKLQKAYRSSGKYNTVVNTLKNSI